MSVYQNIRPIASGGFADVFECASADGAILAKKVLKKTDDWSIKRFVKEVRILSTLDHPNIIKVVATSLLKPPYHFVMPKYAQSLESCLPEIVGQEKRIEPIFTAVLNAIEYAHQQNVIHRDLKPANVLLNSDSEVVVSDFGFGRVMDSNSSRLTQSGEAFGTPGYACPEQWDDDNVKGADERCDVYTLGIILYELYAGLLHAHPQLDKLPSKIRLLVERCLKQDKEERFQSVSEFKRAWFAIMNESNDGHLKTLAVELSDPAAVTLPKLQEFATALAPFDEDGDAIHTALLTAGPDAIAALNRSMPEFTRGIMQKFIQHAVSQRWPTDRAELIAAFGESLLDRLEDIELKATILSGLISMAGSAPGLFRVTNKVRRRLLNPLSAAESEQLCRKISLLDARVARDFYNHVAIHDRLTPSLRTAFETAIVGEDGSGATLQGDWPNFLSRLSTDDPAIFAKLTAAIQKPEFRGRTVLLRLQNTPVERLSYHVPNFEQCWKEANGFAAVFLLIP